MLPLRTAGAQVAPTPAVTVVAAAAAAPRSTAAAAGAATGCASGHADDGEGPAWAFDAAEVDAVPDVDPRRLVLWYSSTRIQHPRGPRMRHPRVLASTLTALCLALLCCVPQPGCGLMAQKLQAWAVCPA